MIQILFLDKDKDEEKQWGKFKRAMADTSIQKVLERMKYRDNVEVRKGFVPATFEGVEEKFAFVNLDMDLYEPTYQGLEFFAPKMVKNGAILVHDFFSTDFYGPNKAVNEFLDKNSKYSIYPIGDGISILITGF